MAILMPHRTQQITGQITATSNPQSTILYTPSTALVLGTPVNYNGTMARIRICASIDSLPQVYTPIILSTDTEAQREEKNTFFREQPKKGLMIYLVNPADKKFEVGVVDIYNVKPRFLTGVNEFFSDLEIYGIQFGYKISIESIDRGYGLLDTNNGENQQNDQINFTGFANEESSFLQGNNDEIYNYIT
jgi:hypothetical protein